jgi:hypothetical protein
MLRAGYVDIYNLNDRTAYDADDVSATPAGVPQPFCNIFFHQMDVNLIRKKYKNNLKYLYRPIKKIIIRLLAKG